MTKNKSSNEQEPATELSSKSPNSSGPTASDASSSSSPRAGTKAEALIALITRPEGATIEELSSASGWLSHSVRGFLAGTLKKKYGVATSSGKEERGRVYRLTASGADA